MVSSEGVGAIKYFINDQNFLFYGHHAPPLAVSVGRITGRLPKELADEVVQSLLEFFRYEKFYLKYLVYSKINETIPNEFSVFERVMVLGMVAASLWQS